MEDAADIGDSVSDSDRRCWRCGHRVTSGMICPICGSVIKWQAELDGIQESDRDNELSRESQGEEGNVQEGVQGEESELKEDQQETTTTTQLHSERDSIGTMSQVPGESTQRLQHNDSGSLNRQNISLVPRPYDNDTVATSSGTESEGTRIRQGRSRTENDGNGSNSQGADTSSEENSRQ
jgi:hypothetical protein